MGSCALNREDVPCASDEHVFRPEVYEAAAGDAWIEDECCTSCGWSGREIADHDRGNCCCPGSHATSTAVCERVKERCMVRTNQDAYDEIQKILTSLPTEGARQVVLLTLLTGRCRKCFAYDPSESFRCCNSRGG